jgi:hypothetical protein
MRHSISERLAKKACELVASEVPGLTEKDATKLMREGPTNLKKVQSNIKDKIDALEGIDEDNQRTLLAYVVYFRQNLANSPEDAPNIEDAAMILKGPVYAGPKDTEKLAKELKRQLGKVGIACEGEE